MLMHVDPSRWRLRASGLATERSRGQDKRAADAGESDQDVDLPVWTTPSTAASLGA